MPWEWLQKLYADGKDIRGFYHEKSGLWFRDLCFISKEGELHTELFSSDIEEFLDFKFYCQRAEDEWGENTLDSLIDDLRQALERYKTLKAMLRLRDVKRR